MIKPITLKDLAGIHFKLPDDQIFLDKINELCYVVNEQKKQIDKMSFAILDLATPNGENKAFESIKAEPYAETRQEIVRPPYMQNKRLRKALSIAQSALVKLANDAYDFDEHIYIDKILNQIERITKGGDNE